MTFTDTVATGSGGTTEDAEDSDVIELENFRGTILSSVIVSDTEVVVKYV
jgi:hypothetical protein